MTQVASCAATVAAETNSSGLARKLIALRDGIDAALAELASPGTAPAAAGIGKPSQPLSSIRAEISALPGDAGPVDALDELGVIGCLLGLRSDAERR